jgi:hypothetical protein
MVEPIKKSRTPHFLYSAVPGAPSGGASGKRRIRKTYTVMVADNFHNIQRKRGIIRRVATVNDGLTVQPCQGFPTLILQ